MGAPPKNPCRNGSASSCARLAILFLQIMMLVSSAAIIGATNPEEDENSEYFFACSGGELSTIKTLLETDASLVHKTTKDGEHCLHLSAISGNTEIVSLLLQKGADPDIRTKFSQGLRMHPLSWNTYYGRFEILELLLKAGADVNADFDLRKTEVGDAEKVTVLDVVEQILMGTKDDGEKERFIKTRNVLVKNGAMRYASVEPEL